MYKWIKAGFGIAFGLLLGYFVIGMSILFIAFLLAILT